MSWYDNLDLPAFASEIRAIGEQLRRQQGEDDVRHLSKIIRWRDIAFWLGYLTCWVFNPISVLLLSVSITTDWTMIGHHVCHGGYTNVPTAPVRCNRFRFAIGWYRRACDWLDWMLPEAWNIEHNHYHHYALGEEADPDLVEENLEVLRTFPAPVALKYLAVLLMMPFWKWTYYAPNTLFQKKKSEDPSLSTRRYLLLWDAWMLGPRFLLELVLSMLPYPIWRFLVLPAPFFAFGTHTGTAALASMVLAELLSNIHSFIVIVPNHAGDDVYRFDTPCKPKSDEFYLRQVIGSVNFACGDDATDFLHGWLNYQIEHHLFPSLSMLSYQRAQPLVRAVCQKHGVPYVQQNVFHRTKKLMDIMVGKTRMRRL